MTEEERCDLGPYAEALRLFLLGDQSFPEGIVLLTLVSPSERLEPAVTTPARLRTKGGASCRRYKFSVPGITFVMLVGRSIPPELRGACTVRSSNACIQMFSKVDEIVTRDVFALFRRGIPKGKLARGVPGA